MYAGLPICSRVGVSSLFPPPDPIVLYAIQIKPITLAMDLAILYLLREIWSGLKHFSAPHV